MKTGNTRGDRPVYGRVHGASMEPGHEDREYRCGECGGDRDRIASMEPGHEDREYLDAGDEGVTIIVPQWSPVMKTGNTWASCTGSSRWPWPQWSPVMKTGNTCN